MLAGSGHEETTESGYLRSLSVSGAPSLVAGLCTTFAVASGSEGLWEMEPGGEGVFFSPRLWPLLRGVTEKVSVNYHEAALVSGFSTSSSLREIPLASGRRIAVVRQPVSGPLELGPEEVDAIMRGDEESMPREIRQYERIEAGLAEYY